MAESVLAAFKRFDQDGNGSISREELAAVLKELNPDFEDATLHQLFSSADASGDGQLQLEEFIAWIFAEDQQLSFPGAPSFGFTYVISNAPRAELNGEYVQQDQQYGHRPVFYCAGTGKYLFYHAPHRQWQIYAKPSTRAIARLKTQRSPQMALGANWEVRQQTGTEATYVEVPEMSCTVVPPPTSIEEMIEKAPQHIYVQAEDSRIHGGFSKNDQPWHDRPTWFNKVDKTFLLYDKDKVCWKICTAPQDATAILAVSRSSEVWSPELTTWEGPVLQAIDLNSPVAQEILEKQKAEGKEENTWNKGGEDEPGFIDPDFPPSDESLGENYRQDVPKEWVRAIYLRGHQEQPVLFEDMEPANVCQGGCGDCWLIAAIAAVAEFPSFIKDHLFSGKELSQEGKYEIRLYNWWAGEFQTITVDDRIPCKQRKGLEPKPYPLFAQVPDREVYVPILEKAFAKFHGSYKALGGGAQSLAFLAMTGETRFLPWRRKYFNPKWSIGSEGVLVRKDCSTSAETLGRLGKTAGVEELDRDGDQIKYKKMWGDGPKEGWFSLYLQGEITAKCFEDSSDEQWVCRPQKWDTSKLPFNYQTSAEIEIQDNDAMWSKIREYDDANYLMGANLWSNRYRKDGLVSGHAYSIIHAVEIEGLQLVCCRNPWGRVEWNGPWSDGSAEWTRHPAVAEALQVSEKQDGLFWMDWQTFSQIFLDIGVCPKSMPSKRADFDVNHFGGAA
ncbi:unnamed protein product [Cladocopium goreaui]|uniref:Calpain-15 (Small optic lobes homolog) n=1 Tax=Cladocopium goreaui TaxID=2562237 RepID=A0A9P1D5I9_9DINO|nr:unnamed protein product [Cladocopium goreaui]|mmetsp:Transcript_19195/g.40083  ORF Transcript_19195/g.40083 Transcript_19195/m.40083 type:complete len:727 (+) Transcript_19195:50-2230(+)